MPKSTKFYCPCCGSQNTRVTNTEPTEGSIGETTERWLSSTIECMECPNPIYIRVEVALDSKFEQYPPVGESEPATAVI